VGGGLDDTDAEFQQAQADGDKLGSGERLGLWDDVANGEDQPISSGVEDQPHLVGARSAAIGAVRSELGLVQLDQVLGLTTRAIERLADVPGGAGG
jgi:hypothetical protein